METSIWRGAHGRGAVQSPPSPTSGYLPPPRPLQVHCISTEFTPRKHGGEKGVPFRVQIDTFKQSENGEYKMQFKY